MQGWDSHRERLLIRLFFYKRHVGVKKEKNCCNICSHHLISQIRFNSGLRQIRNQTSIMQQQPGSAGVPTGVSVRRPPVNVGGTPGETTSKQPVKRSRPGDTSRQQGKVYYTNSTQPIRFQDQNTKNQKMIPSQRITTYVNISIFKFQNGILSKFLIIILVK